MTEQKLVPVEPTEEMMKAADAVDWSNEYERGSVHNMWNVMLAAAPPAPSGWRSMESAPRDGTHVDVWAVVRTTQEGIPDRGKRYENAALGEA